MKKTFIKLPLFLLFIFGLILGLSYLSLDQPTTSTVEQTNNDMSIALVNEDEGAIFNDEQLDFGNTFVQSLNHNYNHEWFVVSRGVAENGLQNNTYDMMIIIPKDFTRKALSIDSDTPEQVELTYKINAADSEAVRAQAEETASTILNDFNRRIIDVYFASIIGNLQNAQDNVAKIVEDYEGLTNTYRSSVHDPLSGYTGQFGLIKSNTELSKDSFSGFENTLDSYESTLTEQIDSFDQYQSNIGDVQDTKQSNSVMNQDFAEKLGAFQSVLNHQDVNNTLSNLEDFNTFINFQFQKSEEEGEQLNNIAFHSNVLQHRLNEALEALKQDEEAFDIELINQGIRERLAVMVEEAFDGQDQVTLLLESQQKRGQERIEQLIANLPTLNKELFDDSYLSPNMTREINNVIDVTRKYNEEFRNVWPRNDDVILPEYIDELKENLYKNGYTMTDTVELPESELEEPMRQLQILNIPEGFNIDLVSIKINDEERVYRDYQENETIDLSEYPHGLFTISLTLKLKEDYLDQPIDIYEMKQWEWKLQQLEPVPEDEEDDEDKENDINPPREENKGNLPTIATTQATSGGDSSNVTEEGNDGDANDQPNEEGTPVEDEESTKGENTDEAPENETPVDGETQPTDGDTPENPSDETPSEDGGNSGDGEDNAGDGEGTGEETPGDGDDNEGDNGGEEDSTPPLLEVIVEKDIHHHHHHHYIHHKVTSPMIDEATEDLVKVVEDTVAPYQKLLSTYEAYFGVSLSCHGDIADCGTVKADVPLKDMITNDSLYALFQKDIGELLTDYIADQVIVDVHAEIRSPLRNYEMKLRDQQRFIDQTLAQSNQLAEKVVNTRNAAQELNTNLAQLLTDVAAWRDQAMALAEDQGVILSNLEEEQTMVMSLNEGFQPLLHQSQSLKEQASSNLNEADMVYQTFDRIDEQANDIQESGSSIVQQAETLANNMTNKLMTDQEFAENFTTVMANSRIGERQNEDLYDFLSNPVQTKNEGVIIETNNFSPYFLVLISALVALFTGYGISTFNQKRTEDDFEQEQSLVAKNSLMTAITGTVGIMEGILLGLVSGYLLQIEGGRLLIWTLLMILIMVSSVLVATYLLRQLEMIGMFILLSIISMYLFLTDALSNSIAGVSAWRDFSPLHYVERLMRRAVQASADYGLIVLGLILVTLIAVVANLLVVSRRNANRKTEDETDVA
ncbi:type VII secretion EsaA-like protein [Gracilibacillus halotolerans]|uniref:Type VII secretion system accessory factor EsaA n=1 Tax=Gracilibacillus halotolerans TaxID=74386 RepID=A0A841RMW9_9BACI|nr:type VII secretion protein EsaA [Gracilibacillus halotolerans]MBB6512973.1 type VII secretion EsaA-like protein [Gracilibacillus halotolerans]